MRGGVHTKNDAKYYGVSIYGRIDNSNTALLGDISYMHSKGDITQYNSGVDITAKPKSDAFSVGIRAEWAVKIGENAKLMPFAGMRYIRLGTGDYENGMALAGKLDERKYRVYCLLGDGEINDLDLLMLARYMIGCEKEQEKVTGVYLKATDMYNDGRYATDKDLLKLARELIK